MYGVPISVVMIRLPAARFIIAKTGFVTDSNSWPQPSQLTFLDLAVLSNHVHVILRNRPDLVAQWSNKEVARRWWQLFPRRKDKRGLSAEPTAQELRVMTSREASPATWRLSWSDCESCRNDGRAWSASLAAGSVRQPAAVKR